MANKAFYTAWAEVAPDFSKFGREVDKGFRNSLVPAGKKGGEDAGKGMQSGVLGAAKSLAGPLLAVFAGFKLGEALVGTIKAGVLQANDLEQTTSAIRTVFGEAAAGVEDFAKTAVSELGITQQQALEASQMFGVFGKAAGLTGGDLSGFSNDLAGLGADLAAFYGGDIQTALDAISSGLRGESEPLRQFGVLLDDATLKQRALEMGISDGTSTLTQQQRVLAAQAEILAQTTDAQGAAAREGETFDGQLKRLQAGWESLVTTIGQAFLPVVTQVVGFLNQQVLPAVQGVLGILLNGEFDGGLFAQFGIAEDSGIVDFLFSIRDAFQAIVAGDWGSLFNIFTEFRNTLITNVADAFPSILTAVVEGLSSLVSTVVDVLPGMVEAFVGLIPMIVSALTAAAPLLVEGAVTLFNGLADGLSILVPQLITSLVALIPMLVNTLVSLIPVLIQGAITLFMALVNALPVILPMLIQALVSLLPVLVAALGTLVPALIEGAVQLFLAIVHALPLIIPPLITAILDLIPVLISTVISLLPVLLDAAVQLFTGIVTAIPEILPALTDSLIELGPKIVETIIGLVPQLFEAGQALIQGLIDGVGDMFGAVGEAFGGVMDFVGGFFPHSPAKHGPFSGSGWTGLKKSGGALYDQFVAGFVGDDLPMPGIARVGVPRPQPLDDIASFSAAGGSGATVQVDVHAEGADPVEIGQVTGHTVGRLIGARGQ